MADKRTALAVAVLAFIALGARLAWSAWTQPSPPVLSDPQYYQATALSLARGDGYSVTFTEHGFFPSGDATAFWPPGYSLFLAPTFALLGDRLWAAWVMNSVAGALTVVPIYLIGRRLFGEAAGIGSAAIASLLPSFVFWTPVLMSETLFTFLFACALAAIFYGFGQGRARPFAIVAVGFLIGLAALVRGQALILVPMAAAWWILDGNLAKRALAATGAATLLALGVLAPWAIRNAIVMDSPIVLSANFGYNLRIGHAPYSTGGYLVPQDLWDAEPSITFQDREVVFNNLGTRRALRYVAAQPRQEITLTGHKIVRLWRPDSDSLHWATTFGATPLPSHAWEPLRLLLDVTYLAVLALAGAALLRVRELRRALTFAMLLIAGWTALHVLFFGEPRYHLPLLVVLIPMAASTLVWAAQRAQLVRA
jgi:4-amino-4-deoxy-L-arabinose transferase-like glycosyltransferase